LAPALTAFLLSITATAAQMPPPAAVLPPPILNPITPYTVPQAPPVPVSPATPGTMPGRTVTKGYVGGTGGIMAEEPRTRSYADHEPRRHGRHHHTAKRKSAS